MLHCIPPKSGISSSALKNRFSFAVNEAAMRIFQSNFTRTHAFIAAGFLGAFTALTMYACSQGTPSDLSDRHSLTAALGTASGPFVGALARPHEPSCLKFGWTLLPYCGGILLASALFQFFKLPFRWGAKALRIVVWVLGLLGWFFGGTLSLTYAFN